MFKTTYVRFKDLYCWSAIHIYIKMKVTTIVKTANYQRLALNVMQLHK